MQLLPVIPHPLRLCAPALLAVWLAGCGSGGSDPAPAPVVVAPTVTGTAPATSSPLTTGVATGSRISASFSKPMSAATLTSASVTLACPAGTPVSGSTSYDAATQTVTLTPAAVLPAGTTCEARIGTAAQDSAGVALAAAYVWSFTTATLPDTTRPALLVSAPADLATGVATNGSVTATFSEDMDPDSLSATSLTLFNTTLGTAVPGTVVYAVAARTATFTPTGGVLAADSRFTATVGSVASDLAGNTLAGGARVWTFSTAATGDTTAPTLAGTSPAANAAGVCLTKIVAASFSEAIDAATVSTATFTVTDNGVAVAGSTSYDAASRIATFTPANAAGFGAGRAIVATLVSGSAGIKDLAGNTLAADTRWGFNTGTQACAAGPNLRVVAAFGVFGGSAGVSSQGLDTHIDGNLGSTAACSLVTGLHDPFDTYTQTQQNIGEVNGVVFCAPPLPGTPTSLAVATQVRGEAQLAYAELLALPAGTDPAAGELGGLVLAPATYTAAAGAFSVTSGDLTLDAQGDPNAVWVFQSATSLTVGLRATPRRVLLVNGARARNVFWQTAGAARVEDGSTLVGTVMAQAGATFSTPGQTLPTTLTGRVTSITGAVTLVNTRIVAP